MATKYTMKQAKEIAKELGMKIRKDMAWEDIIVTFPDGSKAHFYMDLDDAVDTMKHYGMKAK